MFWGAKKKFEIFFKKYCSVCTKKLHKLNEAKNFFFHTWKKKFNSNWIYLQAQNFRYYVLYLLYSDLPYVLYFYQVWCSYDVFEFGPG